MNKIPTHRISDKLHGEVAMFRCVSREKTDMPSVDYAHKDEYYMFTFLEEGYVRMSIDFKEYEFYGSTVNCLLPGQIHFMHEVKGVRGWMLGGVDSMLVKDEYKEAFEKASFLGSDFRLDEDSKKELRSCTLAIQRRLQTDRQHIEQSILFDLFSYFIGMIAQIYQKGLPVPVNSRLASITFDFKSLLSVHYQSRKRSSKYASLLNISPAYLNEAVRKTTGMTVSEWVQNEVILHAKRLLYYTDMSVKEVALELGYEDWAYFTRLFTKVCNLSPTLFRRENRK